MLTKTKPYATYAFKSRRRDYKRSVTFQIKEMSIGDLLIHLGKSVSDKIAFENDPENYLNQISISEIDKKLLLSKDWKTVYDKLCYENYSMLAHRVLAYAMKP